MTTLEMIVNMDCPGCESKVKKALQKLDGVDNFDIDMGLQKVTVSGWAEQEKILKTVRRTGRKAELWPFPHNIPEYHTSTQYFNDQYSYHSDPSSYFTTDHHSTEQSYYNNNNVNVNVNVNGAAQEYAYDYDRYGHGYYGDDQEYDRGYYQHQQRTILDDRTNGTMFSDENVNACSIM